MRVTIRPQIQRTDETVVPIIASADVRPYGGLIHAHDLTIVAPDGGLPLSDDEHEHVVDLLFVTYEQANKPPAAATAGSN